MPRTKIDAYFEDNVAAGSGDTYTLPNIAVGSEHVITAVGAAFQAPGRVFLERRTAIDPNVWTTVRCITHLSGTFEFGNIKAIKNTGDDVPRLRLRRINDHTDTIQIYAWVEGFVR